MPMFSSFTQIYPYGRKPVINFHVGSYDTVDEEILQYPAQYLKLVKCKHSLAFSELAIVQESSPP